MKKRDEEKNVEAMLTERTEELEELFKSQAIAEETYKIVSDASEESQEQNDLIRYGFESNEISEFKLKVDILCHKIDKQKIKILKASLKKESLDKEFAALSGSNPELYNVCMRRSSDEIRKRIDKIL